MNKKETFKRMWIPISKRLPPDSPDPVLVWEQSVGTTMFIEVRNGRKVLENIYVDREMGGESKIKYWMSLYTPKEEE